jgi:glycosyltransferase involved in cell wall biosynthesis
LRVKLNDPQEKGLRPFLGFFATLPFRLWNLYKLCRSAAAVNPHFPGLELIPLALLRRMRLCPTLILSVHGNDIVQADQSSGWQRLAYRWLFRSADCVVACSRSLADSVRRISPKARAIAVWNGVDCTPREPHLRPIPDPYLLCVAKFIEKKGHDVLLQAYSRVRNHRPDLHLVLVGADGPEQERITALIREMNLSNCVHLQVGIPHDEVWNWMHHAECFVLASRNEPFGLVLLEAAVVHLPVVSTRVDGVPEIISDNVHGLLCDSGNSAQIADAVLRITSDRSLRDRLVAAFAERAKSLTWKQTYQGYKSQIFKENQ